MHNISNEDSKGFVLDSISYNKASILPEKVRWAIALILKLITDYVYLCYYIVCRDYNRRIYSTIL